MDSFKRQALIELAETMDLTPEEATFLPASVTTIAKILGRVEANIIYNLNTNNELRRYVIDQIRTLVFEKGVNEGMMEYAQHIRDRKLGDRS